MRRVPLPQFDIVKVRGELVAVYTTDSIRRIAVESLLPLAMHWWAKRMERAAEAKAKKNGGIVEEDIEGTLSDAAEEAELDE